MNNNNNIIPPLEPMLIQEPSIIQSEGVSYPIIPLGLTSSIETLNMQIDVSSYYNIIKSSIPYMVICLIRI